MDAALAQVEGTGLSMAFGSPSGGAPAPADGAAAPADMTDQGASLLAGERGAAVIFTLWSDRRLRRLKDHAADSRLAGRQERS